MPRHDPNVYPKGLTARQVRQIIEHYDNQTEQEAIAEDDAAWRRQQQAHAIMATFAKLKPQFIEKGGKREFVVLSYREFHRLVEALEDAWDLNDLHKARRADKGKKGTPFAVYKKKLGL